MGKPVKIHKKKSFMFTTKHTSFCGILGAVLAIGSIAISVSMAVYAFEMQGNVDIQYGGIGFATVLLNVIGAISGVIGIRERDTYITPSAIAIIGNVLMIVMWIVLIIIAM